MSNRWRILLLMFAFALGQAGLAKDTSRSVDIRMSDAMRFDPAALTIKQDETLRLRIHNNGKLPHEFVWKFSRAGKFYYACLIPGHREAGMQGVVTVTAPVKK